MKKSLMPKSQRLTVIGVCVVIVLGVIIGLSLSYNKIYRGVSVCGTNVGGMNQKDAEKTIIEKFKNADPVITIKADDGSVDLKFSNFAEYDLEKTAQNAYIKGRKNIFSKIGSYLTPFIKRNIPLEYEINEKNFEKAVFDFEQSLDSSYKENSYEIKDDKLIITTGHGGNTIETKKVIEKIKTLMSENKSGEIIADVKKKEFEGVDVNKLYKDVHKEPKNAEYESGSTRIVPQVIGIDFDKAKVKELLASVEENKQYEIQLILKYPEITDAKLSGQLFSDVISSYTTNYNAGETDRSYNMKLAANKINGTIIPPGQTFSYNETVGKRTVAAGYRNAKIFENGEVVDGLAGGICQVSTTLYNTVLYGNFKIVERKNHMFPVSYAPKGQDATVVWGSLDFKFKNNTDNPIKITASVSGGLCTVKILGTLDKNYKVKIENSVVSTSPFKTEYTTDESLAFGEEKITQKGVDGCTVKSVRVVYENGAIVKTEALPTSYYSAKKQKVSRNDTKPDEAVSAPVEVPETSLPADAQTPAEQEAEPSQN